MIHGASVCNALRVLFAGSLPYRITYVTMVAALGVGATPSGPVIQSTSEVPAIAGPIELKGSGFGLKKEAAPVLYDRIDNIKAYLPHHMRHGGEVPVVEDGDCPDCPWKATIPPDWGMRPRLYDRTENARVPGRPAYYVNRKGYFRGFDPVTPLTEADIVYLSWWLRSNHALHYPPSGEPVFNKLLRFTAGDSMDWTEQVEIEPQSCYGTRKGCGEDGWDWFEDYPEIEPGVWHHVEMLIEGGGDLPAGSGRVEVLFDGVRRSGTSNLYSCHGMLDHIYVWGSDPHQPDLYPVDSEILFGELYLDTGRARVVLSDSDRYVWNNAAPTRWEIQPARSWSDTSITIDFDPGALPRDQVLYLYVIDPSGEVSPPFPVSAQDLPGTGVIPEQSGSSGLSCVNSAPSGSGD
ncbi:MAG: hypothetical protein V1774_05660 [Candidatus Eisenbacteria bacterium]